MDWLCLGLAGRGSYFCLIGGVSLFTLEAPRVPTRRRVEITYQKSSFLYENGRGVKLWSVWDFSGRAGRPGREPGEGICYYRCIANGSAMDLLCFSCVFLAFAMDLV